MKTFEPDNDDRVRGCYTSHMKVMEDIEKKLGRKKDYNVLILEDNLEVIRSLSFCYWGQSYDSLENTMLPCLWTYTPFCNLLLYTTFCVQATGGMSAQVIDRLHSQFRDLIST